MVETHISLSVDRLLNEDSYAIPLYQRNFSWTQHPRHGERYQRAGRRHVVQQEPDRKSVV